MLRFIQIYLFSLQMSASEIQATASNLTKVVSFLIERAPQIFKVSEWDSAHLLESWTPCQLKTNLHDIWSWRIF